MKYVTPAVMSRHKHLDYFFNDCIMSQKLLLFAEDIVKYADDRSTPMLGETSVGGSPTKHESQSDPTTGSEGKRQMKSVTPAVVSRHIHLDSP